MQITCRCVRWTGWYGSMISDVNIDCGCDFHVFSFSVKMYWTSLSAVSLDCCCTSFQYNFYYYHFGVGGEVGGGRNGNSCSGPHFHKQWVRGCTSLPTPLFEAKSAHAMCSLAEVDSVRYRATQPCCSYYCQALKIPEFPTTLNVAFFYSAEEKNHQIQGHTAVLK